MAGTSTTLIPGCSFFSSVTSATFSLAAGFSSLYSRQQYSEQLFNILQNSGMQERKTGLSDLSDKAGTVSASTKYV